MSLYDSNGVLIPHRMIIHHNEKQQEQMMNAQETVVKILAHLARGKRPYYD